MKKVLIIGCPGAGKSTFGRALAEKTELPLYHLDMIWHRADRTNISREKFDERLAEIMAKDEWIIDGNYKRTLPVRLKEADTIFFLDYPIEVCIQGAIERLGKPRADVPWNGSKDLELDEEFRQWILDYPKDHLPAMRELLRSYSGHLYVFHDRAEASLWLHNLWECR